MTDTKFNWPWVSSIVLHDSEWIVRGWEGNCQTKTEILTDSGRGWSTQSRYSMSDLKKYQNGVLVLTSQRLLWLEKSGIFSPSYHLAFEIRLEDITGMSTGGLVFRHVIITDSTGPHWFHLGGKYLGRRGKGFPLFKQMIMFQREELLKR